MDKIRIAFIGGGGKKAFFGSVHRDALGLLPNIEVVSGVLTDGRDRNQMDPLEAADAWGIKGYRTVTELLSNHSRDRIDYVVVVTPNYCHSRQVKACLKAGLPVLCEKPFTMRVEEARELEQLSLQEPIPVAISYTYTGYWGMKLARGIVQSGVLGPVRKVQVSYLQGWLSDDIPVWRTIPIMAGASCCGGDIGTHCEMAVRYVTGLEIKKVLAATNTFVPGRLLEDDFNVFCQIGNDGGFALITATQVAVGHRNDHGIQVFCEDGSVEWRQEDPDMVVVHQKGVGSKLYFRGERYENDFLVKTIVPEIAWAATLPSGHVEAFHPALRNIHAAFGGAVRNWQESGKKEIPERDFPNATDGRKGMEFVRACVTSHRKGNVTTLVETG